MPATASKLVDLFRQRTPTSEKLAAQARELFPSGVTHDGRHLKPYPIYIERAEGPCKWDVDGNQYVDYFGGHGALLLGHNHPQVIAAAQQQLACGTHYAACHEWEMRWAEVVQRLLPSAERLRFTSSGTEAASLGFRLARAFTGKAKILRFLTNFHGWQDEVAFGVDAHHDGTATPGVPPELANNTVLCRPGDIDQVERLLAEDRDIAAVILEPTGSSFGRIAVPESFLHTLREVTERHQVLLIFDEVISGFRCSPGGAQAAFGIRPDLTILAKILAGGLPGGAVAGRRDILDRLDHYAAAENGWEKIVHPGTFNANPLSAAAGATALQIVEETDACQRANDYAARLRERMNQVVQDAQLDWCVYGTYSGFHIYTNPDHDTVTPEDLQEGQYDYRKTLAAFQSPLAGKIRFGLLAFGVDTFGWPGGVVSSTHGEEELNRTVEAFGQMIEIFKADGTILT